MLYASRLVFEIILWPKFPKSRIDMFSAISKCFGLVGIIVVALALLCIVPLVFIWAINTLFGLSMAYTFLNFFAAFLIVVILRGGK